MSCFLYGALYYIVAKYILSFLPITIIVTLEKITSIRLKSWIKAFPFPFDCDPDGKSPVVI